MPDRNSDLVWRCIVAVCKGSYSLHTAKRLCKQWFRPFALCPGDVRVKCSSSGPVVMQNNDSYRLGWRWLELEILLLFFYNAVIVEVKGRVFILKPPTHIHYWIHRAVWLKTLMRLEPVFTISINPCEGFDLIFVFIFLLSFLLLLLPWLCYFRLNVLKRQEKRNFKSTNKLEEFRSRSQSECTRSHVTMPPDIVAHGLQIILSVVRYADLN